MVVLINFILSFLVSANFNGPYIEYQINEREQVVVVILDGIDEAQAKKMARVRAAEITVEKNERYFTIVSESKVQVVQPDRKSSPQSSNMYQELIIENDFDRERLRVEPLPNVQSFPAIRLEFVVHKKRPLKGAVDACTLTDCK